MSAQPSKNTHFFSGIITTIGPPKERTDKLIDSIHKIMSEAIQMMKIFPRWTRLRLHVWFSVKLDGKCLSFDSTTFQKKKKIPSWMINSIIFTINGSFIINESTRKSKSYGTKDSVKNMFTFSKRNFEHLIYCRNCFFLITHLSWYRESSFL